MGRGISDEKRGAEILGIAYNTDCAGPFCFLRTFGLQQSRSDGFPLVHSGCKKKGVCYYRNDNFGDLPESFDRHISIGNE
jgi:hypothetical protein